MQVIDTNVFIYAISPHDPDHAPCARMVQSLIDGQAPWYATCGIVYEFLRLVTHFRVRSKPLDASTAWGVMDGLLENGGLRILGPGDPHQTLLAREIAAVPALRGNLMHDLETVITMRAHGISRIVTRDRDFHRFPGITVIDPVAT
ncbi:MAG TPA: PIN domain-containing protein [Gemmatimonadales bacterium]|nr:PIN domain-containing protein [Gemmatimonadales bacterium]